MATHDSTPGTIHETTDPLDAMLRGEISAAETYGQAIQKFEGHPETAALTKLRDDHVGAANLLRRHVAAHREDNSTSSGVWGAFAKAVEGTAMLLGHTSAMQALREGEEHGLRSYEKLLMRDDLDRSARTLITTMLLPRQRAQIVEIERLIAIHASAKKA